MRLLCVFLCFVIICQATRMIRVNPQDDSVMNPGDVVDSFQLSTLSGTFSYEAKNDNSQPALIFFALDMHSGFGEAMWGNQLYVENLFLRSPNDTNYIFLTYATNAVDVVTELKTIFVNTMNALHYDTAKQNQWLSRVHFCTDPVSQINNWIPDLLSQWPTMEEDAQVTSGDQSFAIKRLDGRWPWMQAIDQVLGVTTDYSIVDFGDGCSAGNATTLTGKIALISRDASCYLSEQFLNAQRNGAAGVVVYSNQGESLKDINCRKLSCYAVEIPVTMITYEAGSAILDQISKGNDISIRFTRHSVSGYYFAVDCMSELQEMGNIQYPSMSFLAWEAQYFNYYRDLLNTIEASTVPGTDDFVVNVYNNTVMNGPTNTSVLTFPIPKITEGYSQLILDMDLGCPGPKDSSCPAWDRILQVFICCGNQVDSTVQSNGTQTYFCDQELGRWITPFARRVGRWVTDVTPLLPLFDSRDDSNAQCHFQITCGTTENWVPTLNLRFHDYEPLAEQPTSLLPLFQGGKFDQTYNDQYSPIEFTIPAGTTKILLYAVITGHGSDNNGCGEFCVTSHHFVFNNRHNNSRTFYNAGTPLGCARHASDGVEPNEYGTWLYGRDGWCDGQQVSPWIVDVTDEIDLLNTNTVLYYGYYKGATPDPISNPGYIIMYSYLSFYSEPQA